MWYLYILLYFSVVNKNEMKELETITPAEVTQNHIRYMVHIIKMLLIKNMGLKHCKITQTSVNSAISHFFCFSLTSRKTPPSIKE